MKLAYAGSFDPFTNGHLHVVEKAFHLGKDVSVTILVANNPNKKHHFSLGQRVELIEESTKHLKRVKVVNLPSNEFTVNYAHSIGCNALLRGIRTETDFQDESALYHNNRLINNQMESVYVMPDINLSNVRSSVVMNLLGMKNWMFTVEKLVPFPVFMRICEEYCYKFFGDINFISPPNEYNVAAYHNWQHIAYCMQELDSYCNSNMCNMHGDFTNHFYGMLYHDAFNPENFISFEIYNKMNYFGDFDDYKVVKEVVTATNHTNHGKLNDFQKLVHDIDLSILSLNNDIYDEYAKKVEKEYVEQKGIDKKLFIKGRSDFLKGMLKKKIFETKFYDELKAKENMKRELNSLLERL